jgi:hypothetical protein
MIKRGMKETLSHEERMARVVQRVKDNPNGIYLPKYRPVYVPIVMPVTKTEDNAPKVATTK